MALTENQFTLCQNCDERSQRELYKMYRARIKGVCRRYTKTKEEAEDVSQEVFLRVFKNIFQMHDATCLDRWILKVAINTAINYYHKNKRHRHADEINGYSYVSKDYELILSNLSGEMLVKMISELPDGYRKVFNLHEVQGYSHAEIGDLLAISEVTSRSQLNRAKLALRNRLRAVGVLKYEMNE